MWGENEYGLFLSGESLTGGWGAYEGGDGESALIHSSAGDFKNFPIETMEHRYPLIMRRHSLRGRIRRRREVARRLGHHQGVRIAGTGDGVQLWFERATTPSWGLFGGKDGKPPEVWVYRPGEPGVHILKANNLKVEAGTRILVKTGGGGGWGDPDERSAEDHERDRRLEMVL